MDDISPESLARCLSAVAYIEDMSAWYDEDIEDRPRLEYALSILDQIDRRGELTPRERDWVERHVIDRYNP